MVEHTRRPRASRTGAGSAEGRAAHDDGHPERTCIGCGQRAPKDDLARLVLVAPADADESAPATVVVDAKGGSFGRGANVHPSASCVVAACKKGLSRAFKREVHADPIGLGQAIADAFGRRLDGLLLGGLRAGHVALGTDAVEESVRAGEAQLLVLAADATAAAERAAVSKMTAAGKTLVFGDKLRLARALGRPRGDERDGVAVCAVKNVALATSVRRAWLCAVGLAPRANSDGDAAEKGSKAEA